jgi:endonuclease/exonuclease/phosphatase family metal-dependent hydrolase
MAGFTVTGCGKGARVGRGVIDLAGGGSFTLVNVHASSGVSAEDQACRVSQVDQVFVDLGDGAPAASVAPSLIMGDFNTDPARLAPGDPSAVRWNDFVGDAKPFHFISAVGESVTPTYAGLFNIDHVVSDTLDGTCWSAGVKGKPPVTDIVYFDHKPVVCTIALPAAPR